MAVRITLREIITNDRINKKTNLVYQVIKPKNVLTPEELESIEKTLKDYEEGKFLTWEEFFVDEPKK